MTKREIIAIILWWAEGTKSRRDTRWKRAASYPIEITNTNPAIIKIFVDFLREDIKTDPQKIKLQIQIHKGDNATEFEQYWANITNIPRSQFNKTIIRPVGKKVGKSMGTCKIRFSNKTTYQHLEWRLKKILKGVYANVDEVLRVYEPGLKEIDLLK